MTEKERKWYQKKYAYELDENRDRVYETNYWKIASVAALIPSLVLIFISLGLMVSWTVDVGVPVRREYTNYIHAAVDMYDPHMVVQTLEQALQGIEDLGLEPTDNAAIFSWDKNYRHTPQFSIDQITSVIDYANNFIEWKEQSYDTGVIEVAADVYDAKMSHLRTITHNLGHHSTVAYAYCLNTPGILWYAYDWTLLLIGLVALLAAGLLGMQSAGK